MNARAPIEGRFTLTDHFGNEVSEQSFLGKHQVVFFGFTNCHMVCPRALGKLSEVLDRLGDAADRIQPLYISVDPERDSPEVMRDYLQARAPRFLGLTGTVEQAKAAQESFRVFARRAADPLDPEGYAVPHTAVTYVLDADGDFLTHFPDTVGADRMVEALRAELA